VGHRPFGHLRPRGPGASHRARQRGWGFTLFCGPGGARRAHRRRQRPAGAVSQGAHGCRDGFARLDRNAQSGGAQFATATAALGDEQALAALRFNRENALRYLDAALAELKSLREKLAAEDPAALAEALNEAAARRAAWLADYARGDWETPESPAAPLPTPGGELKRFLVGGLFDRSKKK